MNWYWKCECGELVNVGICDKCGYSPSTEISNSSDDPIAWISIKTKVPELDNPVLVKLKTHPSLLERACEDMAVFYLHKTTVTQQFRWYENATGSLVFDNVTHWMPLPEPPKQ